ncbi:MAG: zf-HC2 domain-containing protein [Gemmatimonadota bacterium]
MTDQWTDRLSEYLDGELTERERVELEHHLVSCASCRATMADLSAVVARAAVLPDREPAADLWPGVRAGLEDRQVVSLDAHRKSARRFSFSLPQLAAAAAALVVLTGGSAWLAFGSGNRGRITPGPIAATTSVATIRPIVTWDRRGRSDSAVSELQRTVDEESGKLDSSTVRVLKQNLALIDRAIDQARKALESDPGNAYLNDHLARTMRKKIEVLRRAADLASQS